MKTLKQKIAVMQAALEGKEIEQLNICIIEGVREEKWKPVETPLWDWVENDYRIKSEEPKPEYVPFESAEEFLQAQKEHGKMVKDTIYGFTNIPYINSNNELLIMSDGSYFELSMSEFCKTYIWQDETPCGKLVTK